jgi:Fe-S-cluster containining protein
MNDAANMNPESHSKAPHSEVPDLLKGRRQVDAEDSFCFGCHPKLPCFTRCCQDINVFLTPTDVLRLARRLEMNTDDFLQKHTQMPITKELHLPVVMLQMGPEPDKRCSFVSEKGCGVYEDRPWACRMYPLGAALPPARAGQASEPVHFLFEDDFCEGHGEDQEWTVPDWKADQNLSDQEELETGFRQIVSHPWFIGGTRQLDVKRMEMFYTACYDLDSFRRFVFSTTFISRFELDEELVERIKTDDEALLRFAFRWLRFALFAEPTMTATDSATQSVTGATVEREQ